MEHTAFRCLDCKVISVFPTLLSDCRKCLDCGEFITPLGKAKIYGKRIFEMNIDVKVNNLCSE